MKIYKYVSIEKALTIIESGRLLLNNPSVFNDPFDTNISRDKKDIDNVRKIIKGFTMATLVMQSAMNPDISEHVRNHPLFITVRKEYNALIKMLKKYPRFDGNFGFDSLYKMLGIKSNVFKEKIESEIKRFEVIASNSIEKTKRNALVTCFSKRYDSILMWSHYADSHSGVCIEYERPESAEFVDVIYSKRRPKMKIAEMVSYITALTITGDDFGVVKDQKLIQDTIYPFLVKSDEWKYEQEVRCLITTRSPLSNMIFEDGIYYYKMPMPTKIYIGCRAKGKTMDRLIAVCKKKKIKCEFLKQDKDNFLLVEK